MSTDTLTIAKFRNGLMEHMSKNRHAGIIVAYACSRSIQDLEANLSQISGPALTNTASAVLRINGVEVRPDNDLTLGSLLFRREAADGKVITPMEPVSVEAPKHEVVEDLEAHWAAVLAETPMNALAASMAALREATAQQTAAVARVREAQAELIRTIEIYGSTSEQVAEIEANLAKYRAIQEKLNGG